MNVELLRFMNRRVRIRKDISHEEYTVLGLDWNSECILLSTHNGILPIHNTELDLVPNSDWDEEE